MPTRSSLSAVVVLLQITPRLAHLQAPARPPLNAKATEALMGPRTQPIYVSEQGDHIAIVTPKGSREVLLIDGVEGPLFDEVPLNFTWSSCRGNGGSAVFSQSALNGKRLFYVAQTADDQWHVVVDAKPGPGYGMVSSLQVTPAGLHYAYIGNMSGVGARYGVKSGQVYRVDLGS
jgi:hypothetical protein